MLSAEDPLIPVPIELDSYVAWAMHEDSTVDVWSVRSRYFHEFAPRMAGFDSLGTPLIPPDTHVLDHLARVWDLVDEDTAAHRPAAATVACPVEELECDLCESRARYETPVLNRGETVPIYACLDCTRAHGDPVLGPGSSVYLMYEDEIPQRVRKVCDEIRDLQGKNSIWSSTTGPEPAEGPAGGDRAASVIQSLRSIIREEMNAVRSDAERMVERFELGEDGKYSLTRSEYDAYVGLVTRANRLKSALDESADGSSSRQAQPAPTMERSTTSVVGTTTALARSDQDPLTLDAKAVSVRLRSLWVGAIGPMLEEHEHDLAEVWSRASLQRVGSELVISAPMNFGEGDPLDDEHGATLKTLITQESGGVITTVTYQYADRPLPKLRRARTHSLDIYHPEDAAAPDCTALAAALAGKLVGAGAHAKPVLAQLTVAGASKFRLWLAAPTEADRKAVGSTPGAAADLHLAIAAIQRGQPLYDIVVDPQSWQRYPKLELG
ncbi:hypothetical protein [Nocardioides aequoreus]|uniref:hypothetical protein n=1 Tax=Nocardioides aequoreus TaxID=397278 RepID=UPI0012F65D54|nr:hypothetical protein [Nocardioides aequoreus]